MEPIQPSPIYTNPFANRPFSLTFSFFRLIARPFDVEVFSRDGEMSKSGAPWTCAVVECQRDVIIIGGFGDSDSFTWFQKVLCFRIYNLHRWQIMLRILIRTHAPSKDDGNQLRGHSANAVIGCTHAKPFQTIPLTRTRLLFLKHSRYLEYRTASCRYNG